MATADQIAAIRKANACRNRHRRERGLAPIKFKAGSRVNPSKGPKSTRCGSRSYTKAKASGGRKKRAKGKKKKTTRKCKKEIVYRSVTSSGGVTKRGENIRSGTAAASSGYELPGSGPVFGNLFK